MFDDLFPRTAFHFDVSVLSSSEWLEGLSEEDASRRWSLAVLSDELLRSCASYHGDGDLFLSSRFLSKLAITRRELNMVTRRGKSKDAIKQEDKADWVGFLDFRLSEGLLSELDDWKPRPADIWTEVDLCIQSGYRFTMSYNPRTHLASVTMICDDPEQKWGGYALSSSDTDGALALKMAVFKHLQLQRDWSALMTDQPVKGRRG